MSSVTAEWLHGPTSSIEHEVARRKHNARIQRLQATLADARRRANKDAFDVEPLAERQRRSGDRVFRLWVEDCAGQGGVSVCASEGVFNGPAAVRVEVPDARIQAMFDQYSDTKRQQKCEGGNHGIELAEFLGRLLDSVSMVEKRGWQPGIQLRLPQAVQPPCDRAAFTATARPQQAPPRSSGRLGSKEDTAPEQNPLSPSWIRENLLARSAGRGRSSCRSQGQITAAHV